MTSNFDPITDPDRWAEQLLIGAPAPVDGRNAAILERCAKFQAELDAETADVVIDLRDPEPRPRFWQRKGGRRRDHAMTR